MSKPISPSEVASHSTPESLYIIIDNAVYDLTSFIDEHPGGAKILKRVGGKDASKQFWKVCLLLFLFDFGGGFDEGTKRVGEGDRRGRGVEGECAKVGADDAGCSIITRAC